MRERLFVFLLSAGLLTLGIGLTQVQHLCPLGFEASAERVAIDQYGGGYVWSRVGRFDVGGSALLDYMPRFGPTPMFAGLPRESHPLNVVLSVSAETRPSAERATFTCVRLRHGSDTWSRRPTNYGVESPQWDLPGASWRIAIAEGGPEWPAGDVISMETWLDIDGQRFVLDFPPFALMKGG